MDTSELEKEVEHIDNFIENCNSKDFKRKLYACKILKDHGKSQNPGSTD